MLFSYETMRIGRTIPPAASPIYLRDIFKGLLGLLRGQREVERFRSELKEYFGVKHCFLVSSGKAALTLILRSLHEVHPERDEVLIPAFCCYSVPSAIVRAGLKVRLCDLDPQTLDFDYTELGRVLNASADGQSKLLAVIPVHLFGLCSDVARVRRCVSEPEVTVIEDSAQVMGNEQEGRKLGTMGDVGFFSLGRGKAFSTVEGGIVVSNSDRISEELRTELERIGGYSGYERSKLMLESIALSVFQRSPVYWFPKMLPFLRLGETIYDPGFKIFKMSPFQAGLARNWRTRLEGFAVSRRNSGAQWAGMEARTEFSLFSSLNGHTPCFLRFPIRVKDPSFRRNLLGEGEKLGLGIMPTYPDSIHEIPELKGELEDRDFPVARKLSREIVTLPVHPLLTEKDKARLLSFLKAAARTVGSR